MLAFFTVTAAAGRVMTVPAIVVAAKIADKRKTAIFMQCLEFIGLPPCVVYAC